MIKSTTLLCLLILFSCTNENQNTKSDRTQLTVWAHSGQQSERDMLDAQIQTFNQSQTDIQIELTFIPEQAYNAQIQAAALANDLPDIIELDGPFLANYAWQNQLMSLDNLLSTNVKDDLIPSVIQQGTYRGSLYAVATFDSGLGLYGLKSKLKSINARIPSGAKDAWTIEEFNAILEKLVAQDKDGAVLDLKLNYPGEWLTYAFSPVIQSAGADLIDRTNYVSANKVLNSAKAVQALTHIQTWIQKKIVDPNIDDSAFVSGRVALSWVGHWEYRHYADTYGEDLILLPLPNFGESSKTGQGSWCWAISKKEKHANKAIKFLEFLLSTEQVLQITKANGAVPATQSAIALSPLYNKNGPLHLYVEQLINGHAIPRPQTPAYPVITSAFQKAFRNIRDGKDIQKALDSAVTSIDQDIKDNKGYP